MNSVSNELFSPCSLTGFIFFYFDVFFFYTFCACGPSRSESLHSKIVNTSSLTLDPVAADWAEEVGVQAVGLFNLVQKFSDIHHLWTHKGGKNHLVTLNP